MKRNTILTTIAALLVSGIIFGNRQAFTSAPQKEKVNNAVLSNNDTLHSSKHRTAAQDTTRTDTTDVRGEGDEPSVNLPDMPETEGYAPTMMSDIEPANPASKINIIAPPTANNHGTASLSYAFEMPPARNGMAPQLGLQYSSDGGSGFCGEGWDLPIPSITVDTRWGVPRYDTQKETETYLLNGVMLCFEVDDSLTTAHRTPNVLRTNNDRRFYTRRGGDFSRIVRKGTSPSNYYWEVTDNNGTVYTYGSSNGTDGMLKGTFTDAAGNSRTVIAEWKLTKVQEIHGDYCIYTYARPDEGGFGQTSSGSLLAKAIYPSSVKVYRQESSNHADITVNFISNASFTKDMRRSNARYGFLTSSNRLLQQVDVLFRDTLLRSYPLTYINGSNKKKLLSRVTHKDNNNQEVSFNQFTYNTAPANFYSQDQTQSVNVHDDDLGVTFLNPGQLTSIDYKGKPTALGGTASTSIGASMYAGIGNNDGIPTKRSTAGVSFSFSHDVAKGMSTLMDIDGDGLPDKVFEKNNHLFYRKATLDGSSIVYGDTAMIHGISSLSKTKTNSTTQGASVVGGSGLFSAGVSAMKTTSKTTTNRYFTDINGDGLIDYVTNGTVYFNHIDEDGKPDFTMSSAATPNPIYYENLADVNLIPQDSIEAERDSLEKYSPMMDVVRVWEAPRNGRISVIGTATLNLPSGSYDSEEWDEADGVYVSIQRNSIAPTNSQIKQLTKNNRSKSVTWTGSVNRGDTLFFRVQSGRSKYANGGFDMVSWTPEIKYTSETNYILPDTLNSRTYKPTDDPVFSSTDFAMLDSAQSFKFAVNFSKPATTDQVTIQLVGDIVTPSRAVIYTNTLSTAAQNITTEQTYSNTQRYDKFRCIISAPSNIKWSAIQWNPQIICGTDTLNVPVEYKVFADHAHVGNPYSSSYSTVYAKPTLVFSNSVSGTITLKVKTENTKLAEVTYSIAGTQLNGSELTIPNANGNTLWFEYVYNGELGSVSVNSCYVKVSNTSPVTTGTNVEANLYALKPHSDFGTMYRGWGGFVYNAGNERFGSSINTSVLKYDSLCQKPWEMAMQPLSVDLNTRNQWVGSRPEIFLTTSGAGCSRLGEQQVAVSSPLAMQSVTANPAGTEARAISQTMSTSGFVVQSSISAANKNNSVTTTRMKSMMMDMNGDGYPDILTEDNIQFTNTLGGLSNDKYHNSLVSVRNENYSEAFGLGGSPVSAAAEISQIIKGGKVSEQNRKSGMLAALNVSESSAKNEENTTDHFLDVNGDGLPDKVSSNGQVRYNLGYTFAPAVTIEMLNGVFQGKTKSTDLGLGTGYDIASSSFSGGLGIALSKGSDEAMMIDMDGDGVQDLVRFVHDSIGFSNKLTAFLSTGTSVHTQKLFMNTTTTPYFSVSTSESANASFSTQFPISTTRKMVISMGGNTAHGMGHPRFQLMDMNGDGLPDFVNTSTTGIMTVWLSVYENVNRLSTVSNSLGGSFAIEYNHSAPSYDHPGGKLVMSAVEVNDGISADGKNQRQTFAYANGKYDRCEREFLGFGTVTTNDINTNSTSLPVYRKHVDTYDVSNWHSQGNLLSASVQNPSGTKLSETAYTYYIYKAEPEAGNSATWDDGMILTESQAGSGCAMFAPLRFTERKLDNVVVEQTHYTYITEESHGEVDTIKYSDKGTLSANGSGTFDRRTVYEYDNLFSQNYHVFCQPTDITVYNAAGTPLVCTGYEYVSRYPTDVEKVTQYLSEDWHRQAITTYEYDSYTDNGLTKSHGNVTKITLPAGADGHSQTYDYAYETVLNTYVTEVRDAFNNFIHFLNYDYRYGVAQEKKDVNNSSYYTIIDDIGRLISVSSPNEFTQGNTLLPTIEYSYSPMATVSNGNITTPAYTVTTEHIRHSHQASESVPTDSTNVLTFNFVDGFGRSVQTRKNGYVMTSTSSTTRYERTIVSGRVNYDPYGRPIQQYQPVLSTYAVGTFRMADRDNVTPITTVYDLLDRPTTVRLPDYAVTSYAYSVSSHQLKSTMTDALGMVTDTYTSGAGLTMREVRHLGNNTYSTSWLYDGMGRPVRVTDAMSNKTYLTYDMAGNTVSVNHPASGHTTYAFDNAGNMTSQTNADGLTTNFIYDRDRLVSVQMPDHPENNVQYYYGGTQSDRKAFGRVVLRVDGSGATEYGYDAMGNVVDELRTIVVPHTGTASFVTKYRYDSYGRILRILYPDNEKVLYIYDRCGNLEQIRRNTKTGTAYVSLMGYDKLGRRVYLKQGNNAATTYTYDSKRQWLTRQQVKNGNGTDLVDHTYTYDAVGNITQLNNAVGNVQQSFAYDKWSRLTESELTDGTNGYFKTTMTHDVLYRVKKKTATMWRTMNGNTQYAGDSLHYTYPLSGNKYRCSSVSESHYSTASSSLEPKISETHSLSYDANGNMIRALSTLSDMRYVWDTQNHLLAAASNGYVSTYIYDGEGKRTVKQHSGSEAVYTNGTRAAMRAEAPHYSLYANPYFVMNDGDKYTEHIYIGSERIAVRVAKLSDESSVLGNFDEEEMAGQDIVLGGIDYGAKRVAQEQVIAACYDSLQFAYLLVDRRDLVNIGMVPSDADTSDGMTPTMREVRQPPTRNGKRCITTALTTLAARDWCWTAMARLPRS